MNEIEKYIVLSLERKSRKKIGIDKIDNLNYWEEGYIDSMGIFLFTVELEEKFGITFEIEDKMSEEFKTVRGLATLIARKLV